MEHHELDRLRQLGRIPAELVFDTADYPLPAGVRRRDVTSRHLLYQAEKLCLDLRVETDPRTSHLSLVGQLADSEDPLASLSGIQLYLLAGEELLARSLSNRNGEFQITVEPRDGMTLWAAVAGDRVLEVPVEARINLA